MYALSNVTKNYQKGRRTIPRCAACWLVRHHRLLI